MGLTYLGMYKSERSKLILYYFAAACTIFICNFPSSSSLWVPVPQRSSRVRTSWRTRLWYVTLITAYSTLCASCVLVIGTKINRVLTSQARQLRVVLCIGVLNMASRDDRVAAIAALNSVKATDCSEPIRAESMFSVVHMTLLNKTDCTNLYNSCFHS